MKLEGCTSTRTFTHVHATCCLWRVLLKVYPALLKTKICGMAQGMGEASACVHSGTITGACLGDHGAVLFRVHGAPCAVPAELARQRLLAGPASSARAAAGVLRWLHGACTFLP